MTDNDFRVYMMPLPGNIRGAVRIDADGFASIYINDALSPEAKKRAFMHELRHLRMNDHYNDRPIEEIECQDRNNRN